MPLREVKITASDDSFVPQLLKPMSKEDRLRLDWRQSSDDATDEEVLNQPFEAALAFLQSH